MKFLRMRELFNLDDFFSIDRLAWRSTMSISTYPLMVACLCPIIEYLCTCLYFDSLSYRLSGVFVHSEGCDLPDDVIG